MGDTTFLSMEDAEATELPAYGGTAVLDPRNETAGGAGTGGASDGGGSDGEGGGASQGGGSGGGDGGGGASQGGGTGNA